MRVNPTVENQLVQGQPPDFAPDRIETRQQYRLGRVVNDQVHPGDRFERPDIASLTADDPALHLVAGQVQNADHALGGLLAGDPLDGVDDDVPGAILGGAAGVVLDVPDEQSRLPLGLRLDRLDQFRSGGVGGQSGDPLQFPAQCIRAGGQLRLPAGEGSFALDQFGLGGCQAPVAVGHPLGVLGLQPLPLVQS